MIREALSTDIPQMQYVRNIVKENMLSNPALVPDSDCEKFINIIGKGWVYEKDNSILGFAIIDLSQKNIWALFVHPEHDKKGIGSQLHDTMLNWYFNLYKEPLWLGTAPKTRAEEFYRRKGWKEVGMHGKEIKFKYSI